MKRDKLLLIGALTQFTLFIPATIWAIRQKQPRIEVAIARRMQQKQSPFSHGTVHVLNKILCSSAALDILIFPMAGLLWKKHRQYDALLTLATYWFSQLIKMGIKYAVRRPRPDPQLMRTTKPRNSKSFPSGDVASTVHFWGWLMTLMLGSKNISKPLKALSVSIVALLTAFVGPARIYLGDHWTSDVLGGYLLGGGWLCLSLYTYRKWQAADTSCVYPPIRRLQ
ncbi:phosphatase PAP2 family protein [Dictyobacter aurantiacus]|uniref:phosphatase PAP2 family protein n=1 Tax=Dictyobacter aurantiacus TaxID=1936993 RepID=UPI000F82B808|nr:phosphatase PAP2 family protein [Dictyobacter aurantiacus]